MAGRFKHQAEITGKRRGELGEIGAVLKDPFGTLGHLGGKVCQMFNKLGHRNQSTQRVQESFALFRGIIKPASTDRTMA